MLIALLRSLCLRTASVKQKPEHKQPIQKFQAREFPNRPTYVPAFNRFMPLTDFRTAL
ncbi:hypothetical protein HMPREF9104_02262 [Lentilactobacillus kisonensis F0435]|uniref:Uncharacterized protein n=1 Tax=Lentilactobacillus kisonensis F0435 TaxID=797516 RepID=H1LI21_9LACO|nr:hypothetical protein HMPREF9104_02262 [Lentilactobacillus kisonensis F0435]